MHIYVSDNSECEQQEAMMKNRRKDVILEIDNNFYIIYAITIKRLCQDLPEIFRSKGVYGMPANLLIPREITNDEIIKTIIHHVEIGYFENVKPAKVIGSKLYKNLPDTIKSVYKEAGWKTYYKINKLVKIY